MHYAVRDLCGSGQPSGCSSRRSRESLRLSEPSHLEQCHIGIGFMLLLSAAEPQPLSRGYPLIRNGPKMATRGELSSSRLLDDLSVTETAHPPSNHRQPRHDDGDENPLCDAGYLFR